MRYVFGLCELRVQLYAEHAYSLLLERDLVAIDIDSRGQVLCGVATLSCEVYKLILVRREYGPVGLSPVFALIVRP